ncbi:polysaccharide deacetylase family protein [Flavobacterium franklandianum]|uniref:polysaccharide deacetylase family protein n=1 Tax=Flavobacterium franklandianum TaxID=2594430 RepID=UPI00163D6C70|nr:polysaccharide deacetylase family protein [Flavobacterium franklandianum]
MGRQYSQTIDHCTTYFDEFELKTTFFVTNLWNPNWTGFKTASLNGHEIASHTLTHPSFATLTGTEILA